MKAIQIIKPGTLRIVETERPQIQSNEVLLRIHYVGFCGSDLNTYRGLNPMVKMPVIPGHEIGAKIVETGCDVPDYLQPGRIVTVNPYTHCGVCPSCRNRRYNACEHNETLGVQRNGAMSDYLAVPWEKVIPVDGIAVRDCALIEPMSVGFHAVARAQATDTDIVAGKTYSTGLGLNAQCTLVYSLPANHRYTTFRALCGYDSSCDSDNPSSTGTTMEFLVYAVKDTDTDYTFDLTLLGYGANEAIPVHDIWNPDSEPFEAMGILSTKVPNHGVIALHTV